MKTLHFISLNSCFDSIQVVVRFTHAYRYFVADNDYAIFIQIQGKFKRQRLKNVFLTRAEEQGQELQCLLRVKEDLS